MRRAPGSLVSDYAREAALGANARRHTIAPAFAMAPATFHQIRLLGVNLNQIARRLNAQDMPPPPELAPLLAEIQAALRKALARDDPQHPQGRVLPRGGALLST